MPDGAFSHDLAGLMGSVARLLLGAPNDRLSKPDELRFGTNGSLSVCIKRGTWYDHEAGEGGGVLDLVMRERRGSKGEALEWLRQQFGLAPVEKPHPFAAPRIVATYPYTDEAGEVLFEVVRFQPKDFRQRRPDGMGGWSWSVKGIKPVPYRLPALAAAAPDAVIYVVEGEKDVEALARLGLVATCNAGGAKKWPKALTPYFAGRHVIILPDNDDAGREHARVVAKALRPSAASVRVLVLPSLPEKGDVSDWIAQGGTAEALARLVRDLPESEDAAEDPIPDDIELTEDGVALEFMKAHRDQLRYCHDTGRWYVWTGSHWQANRDHLAFHWARNLARKLNRNAEFKTKAITGKTAFAGGVEKFAQRDRNFAVTADIWDRDAFLLGTPGGTVDLKTGQLREARREDHITKAAAVAPAAAMDCPTWFAFLNQATAGDAHLIRFLSQWAGYCLTGSTREHALLFIYGPGGNGKSVFLNTVAGILADYCTTAPMDTFTSSPGDRHPTDLAMLRGARLVTATETEEGRAWAEAKIKQMTGGDPVTARFMRQDFFTFTPAFKLTIAGNHKPALKNVDDAARRRFNVVPFTHKPEKPDRDLEAKLRAEWPGILRWMITGCLDWQRNGLDRPAVVTEATAEYFEAQDTIGRWMAERCVLAPHLEVKPGLLAADCRTWAAENGEAPPSAPQLRSALEKVRGVRYATVKGTQWVKGIGLQAPEDARQGGGGWR